MVQKIKPRLERPPGRWRQAHRAAGPPAKCELPLGWQWSAPAVYYKSAFNRPGNVWICHGIAIADNRLGPFTKHPLNPIANSGHAPAMKGHSIKFTPDEHYRRGLSKTQQQRLMEATAKLKKQ